MSEEWWDILYPDPDPDPNRIAPEKVLAGVDNPVEVDVLPFSALAATDFVPGRQYGGVVHVTESKKPMCRDSTSTPCDSFIEHLFSCDMD